MRHSGTRKSNVVIQSEELLLLTHFKPVLNNLKTK